MVDVGPGIVDLLGITREEWLATSEGWRDVLHPDDLDRIVDVERAHGRDGRAVPRAVPRDPSRRPRGVDPRRRDPRGRRGRHPAVLARADARRHRHRSHRARAPGGPDEVRRARRADPRDRLRGRRRRADDHELRQPADRGVAGRHARGVHRRPRPVGDAPASGGPGRDARHLPRGARRGRTVHARVPPHRTGRAHRVVPRQRRRGPRRGGSAAVRPGRDARHHRSARRRRSRSPTSRITTSSPACPTAPCSTSCSSCPSRELVATVSASASSRWTSTTSSS